ncbi:NADH dehydrogenase [ubiquinone] 1 alpha subcomplex assembly factor 2 isoform X1 [Coffea eugenioides]|uniref:NADH dehydrogenase [ubiquinone] 1 alpha subcomplex assembly factor 2 isoform X1 n=1 Tax=Coffea eugenioides TaxID=49369 RepID=UPI000F6100A8|nr:NADH dehydrogenase [ubiquinone] 1 alpha subcomplex assembly factor 2 isoform X1 [Coffea eugenioides]
MSRFWAGIVGLFRNRTMAGMDKAGNRYFTRMEEIDGVMKEKRWVVFKGEQEPTSVPVEWICWLNGQRKIAPTPEEMAELEARRERVRLNVALLKKEEEERGAKGLSQEAAKTGKVVGPDLKSFIRQLPVTSEGDGRGEALDASGRASKATDSEKQPPYEVRQKQEDSSEPTGTGESFRPGTWQPPT